MDAWELVLSERPCMIVARLVSTDNHAVKEGCCKGMHVRCIIRTCARWTRITSLVHG